MNNKKELWHVAVINIVKPQMLTTSVMASSKEDAELAVLNSAMEQSKLYEGWVVDYCSTKEEHQKQHIKYC